MADELAARRARKTHSDFDAAPLASLLPSFVLSLEQRQLSARTLEVYERTGRQFTQWLEASHLPSDADGISAEHVRAFLAAEVARTSAVSAHQHYRNLCVIFKWLIREDERQAPDPMPKVDPPKVSVKLKGVLADEQLAALLRGCEGNTFEQRRDMAIIRIFIDSGVRLTGLASVKVVNARGVSDVSLGKREITITLKGGDEHIIPVGRKAVAATDRYLRARARHPCSGSDWLWLGIGGRDRRHFGAAGIQDMLERRGKAAGIDRLTPHWFRRTFAHDYLDAGGSPMDAMSIGGWKTMAMVQHYAGSLAAERARAAHAKLAPGDRL
jgi:site-specific recombinase XerD